MGKRKKLVIDVDNIRKLAAMGCTLEEIADLAGYKQRDFMYRLEMDAELSIAFHRGSGELKQGLRGEQLRVAMNGNAQMLIWLGKQYLGQSEKVAVDKTVTNNHNILLTSASAAIGSLSREQVLALRSSMRSIIGGAPAGDHGGGGGEIIDAQYCEADENEDGGTP